MTAKPTVRALNLSFRAGKTVYWHRPGKPSKRIVAAARIKRFGNALYVRPEHETDFYPVGPDDQVSLWHELIKIA